MPLWVKKIITIQVNIAPELVVKGYVGLKIDEYALIALVL